MKSATIDQTRRAHFDALRQTAFAEMSRTSARMRLMWTAPFHALILSLLIDRGFSVTRSAIYGGSVLLSVVLFKAQAHSFRISSLGSFLFGFLGVVVGLAVTGGLRSPLVPTGIPILIAASVVLESKAAKAWFYGIVVAAFVLLAILSGTPVGDLVTPLAPVNGHASPEFAVIAGASLVFTALSLSRFGQHIASLYERVAFELVARREELCSENVDRTRELEGIAARLAHEVKNPLAAIKGLSTHMARSATDPKTAERLSIVAAEADRLQGIVEGFLSFSRGLDDLHPTATKPYELARELTLLLETRAADAGVALEVVGDTSATLEADARKLRQALLNLVLNAMQASPRGEKVTIEVGRTCAMSYMTTIRVQDRGPGMTPEVLDRIKKPYFTTREGGSGLGIAVSRGIIEQHGGSLEYESAPGKGTTVIVRLPLNALAATQEAPLPKVECSATLARCIASAAEKRKTVKVVPQTVQEEKDPSHEEPIAAKI